MTALIVIVSIVVLGIAVLVLLSGIALYARLMGLRRTVTSSRSEIDRALRKRYESSPERRPGELQENIAGAVCDYNAAAQDYNIAINTFPAQIIAKLTNLKKVEFFDTKIF